MSSLYLDENYSEKACVVFGDQATLHQNSTGFLAINGTLNYALRPQTDNGPKRAGFVFPKKKLPEVKDVLKKLSSGEPIPQKAPAAVSTGSSNIETLVKNMSARLEALESEVQALRKLVTSSCPSATSSSTGTSAKRPVAPPADDDDEGDMEDEVVVKSLIKRNK